MQHRFQIHLGGIIDLLSHHLYSGPEVFIRELLQNGVDAIHARRMIDASFTAARLDLRVMEADADTPATLEFQDNGIGLTEDEVHRFLATIGESSKRVDDLEAARGDFLGQFGIGLLSCFMVCDEIVMITRSARDKESPAVEWRGRSDGTYAVRILDRDISVGTRVFLRSQPESASHFEPARLRERALHFGRLLRDPIYFGSESKPINDQRPPWQSASSTDGQKREQYMAFGEEQLGEPFADYVPLGDGVNGVEGVAYIRSHPTAVGAKNNHRVYLRNMLLTEKGEDLLPQWAVFARCVLNVRDLRPVASRERFVEDDLLAKTREALGEQLRNYLIRLAEHDPDRLSAIVGLHHIALAGLASHDEDCFRVFGRFFEFETSMGRMRLGDYLAENDQVRFVASRDEFRQIAQVAASQNMCVINAGYVFDLDMMEMLKRVEPDLEIVQLDAAAMAREFEDLSFDEREQTFDFIRVANVMLQPFRCQADIKKFEPAELPTLYSTGRDGLFNRQARQARDIADNMWGDMIDGVVDDAGQAQLCFNLNNSLVQRIASVTDKTVLERAIQMLYVQSLLLGHHPLSSREMLLLNDGLLGMIDASLRGGE